MTGEERKKKKRERRKWGGGRRIKIRRNNRRVTREKVKCCLDRNERTGERRIRMVKGGGRKEGLKREGGDKEYGEVRKANEKKRK
jgi:hypothetical protein